MMVPIGMRMRLLPADTTGMRRIADVVARGGLIVYPTDTLYGIGCDPFNENALERVQRLKGRGGKPFPVLVSGITAAKRLVVIDRTSRRLMETFWPGALTVVLKGRRGVPVGLSGGTGMVGVRMPASDLALMIIGSSGGALLGTSANASGKPPARSVAELDPAIEGGVELVVDGGPTQCGVPSTVVEVSPVSGRASRAARVRTLREGALGIDAIKSRAEVWRREGIEVDFL